MTGLAQAGAALLGGTLANARPLAGGDLSCVVRIVLADGREAVVKSGPAPRAEAAMLRAIKQAGAPAPDVLGADAHTLVLECLPGASGVGRAWASLGQALARLHATTGEQYGWPENYSFGAVAIDNGAQADWPGFWAVRRLLPHAPHVAAALARRLETLARDLPNRLPARPSAALLHGDLWSGNVMTAGGAVTGLIDPACYYGHAEVDIAMLGLFDSPTQAFFETYGGLPAGAAERLNIYRLWPALVHLRLFGAGYSGLIDRCLSSAGV